MVRSAIWAWAAAALLMMPPLAWLAPGVADATGLALGLALVVSERRARVLSRPPVEAAAAPTVHR